MERILLTVVFIAEFDLIDSALCMSERKALMITLKRVVTVELPALID